MTTYAVPTRPSSAHPPIHLIAEERTESLPPETFRSTFRMHPAGVAVESLVSAKRSTRLVRSLGRSRGGLTSKIHFAVGGRGLPMSIILTAGQAGDNPQLLPLLDQINISRDGPGRPRTRPDRVVADKAYSHQSTRAAMREPRIPFTCPRTRARTRFQAPPTEDPPAQPKDHAVSQLEQVEGVHSR